MTWTSWSAQLSTGSRRQERSSFFGVAIRRASIWWFWFWFLVVVMMVVQQPAVARAAQCNPSSMDGQNGKWAFPKSLQGSRVRKEGTLNRGGANLALGLYIESIYPDRPLVVVNERWSNRGGYLCLIWLWLCCCCSLQCLKVYVLYMSPYKYTPGLGTGRECSSALPDIHRE